MKKFSNPSKKLKKIIDIDSKIKLKMRQLYDKEIYYT